MTAALARRREGISLGNALREEPGGVYYSVTRWFISRRKAVPVRWQRLQCPA